MDLIKLYCHTEAVGNDLPQSGKKSIRNLQGSSRRITSTLADIRIILSPASKTLVLTFIVAHNHPSGSLQPIRQDGI